jgi:hypothetical protein
MGLLDIFKSKKRKELDYLQLVLSVSTEIFEILTNKKSYSDRGIINLSFDENMKDRLTVMSYFKSGVLDVFDEDYRMKIVNVFSLDEFDENYKSDLENSYLFLRSFTNSLREQVEEKKKDLEEGRNK